jgi:hypothetical protein
LIIIWLAGRGELPGFILWLYNFPGSYSLPAVHSLCWTSASRTPASLCWVIWEPACIAFFNPVSPRFSYQINKLFFALCPAAHLACRAKVGYS